MHILFSGGGTLGPVVPLLAIHDVIERETKEKNSYFFIGTKDGPEKSLVEEKGMQFFSISAPKFDRYFSLRLFSAPFLFVGSIVRSFFLLKKIRPDVVVSAGAYVAVPVSYAAWFLRIPVVLHQMDILVGLANRMMMHCASKITVSVPELLKSFPEEKTVVTGIPVRAEIERVLEERTKLIAQGETLFGLDVSVPTLLVFGGGTGALVLNELVSKTIRDLVRVANVIHVTGKGKHGADFVNKRYVVRDLLHEEEFAIALATSDFVASRAGMGSIAELSAVERPFVLIPLSNSPQEKNAVYFHEKARIPVMRNDVSTEVFLQTVSGYLKDPRSWPGSFEDMRRVFPPRAAELMAHIVVSVGKKK